MTAPSSRFIAFAVVMLLAVLGILTWNTVSNWNERPRNRVVRGTNGTTTVSTNTNKYKVLLAVNIVTIVLLFFFTVYLAVYLNRMKSAKVTPAAIANTTYTPGGAANKVGQIPLCAVPNQTGINAIPPARNPADVFWSTAQQPATNVFGTVPQAGYPMNYAR